MKDEEVRALLLPMLRNGVPDWVTYLLKVEYPAFDAKSPEFNIGWKESGGDQMPCLPLMWKGLILGFLYMERVPRWVDGRWWWESQLVVTLYRGDEGFVNGARRMTEDTALYHQGLTGTQPRHRIEIG